MTRLRETGARLRRHPKLMAASLAVTAAGLGLAGAMQMAGSASAVGANVSSWNTTWCYDHGTACFFYSQHGDGAHAIFQDSSKSDLSGYTFSGGGAGNGDAVRNHAASMSNGYANCSLYTYVFTGFEGDYNYVTGDKGGNLSTGSIPLRNNEASYEEHC